MSRSNRNMPFSMQSEFDSDAYDSDEYDHEGNSLSYEVRSKRLMIEKDFDQRRRQLSMDEMIGDSGNEKHQYMEGYDSGVLVVDNSSEDDAFVERNTENGKQLPSISPPLQKQRQNAGIDRFGSENEDEGEEEVMD